MVFSQLEKEVDGDSGIVIIPKNLMGNISQREIEVYMGIKGYNVYGRGDSGNEVHFHYRLKGVAANAQM